MRYYEVALLRSPLSPLTYHSSSSYDIGDVVRVKVKKRELVAVIIQEVKKPEFDTENIIASENSFFLKYQQELASFIAKYYLCSLGEAYSVMQPMKKAQEEKEVKLLRHEIILSSYQQKALLFLKQHKRALLFGKTGSGKTEIYSCFFQDILEKNKQVLLLLPEISLTPQMERRLKEYFGDGVVMWHSKLTKKQKEKILNKIYTKEARVIAGARSALFLPFLDLGAIVVDEEHDDSYKSQTKPRYNAKDLALYLGKSLDIPVILGSATPSVQSFYNYPYYHLQHTFFQTKKEYIYHPSSEALDQFILDAIKQNLAKKEQMILFVPTRANFKYLQCRECGEDFKCAFCHIGMSLHIKHNALKCHYCGFTQPIPKMCPSCNKDSLVSSRIGSAEIVETLKTQFEDATIEQFDRDTITTQKKLTSVLDRFNKKQIDILVGTQMLTKGHDYHGVTLAIVVGMDHMLGMGDYRAKEKALSTLIQIAGRSGRKKDAKVIIQTFHQEFFSAYMEDYKGFLEDELYFRKELYPPFMRLARIIFSDKNALKAKKEMDTMVEKLRFYEKDVTIMGYGECNIAKIGGKYRYEILLRAKKPTPLLQAIKATKSPLAQVDIDPIEFS